MNLPAGGINLAATIIGVILTLIIFSYVLGDNFLFRLAVSLFIGVASGFGCLITYRSILYPSLLQPLLQNPQQGLMTISIPLILSLLLVFKFSPRWSNVGNPSVALMVGVGAATVVGGAVQGTLLPQILASINQFDLPMMRNMGINPVLGILEGGIVLLGTITTLAYFHFGVRQEADGKANRAAWLVPLSWMGQFFIAIALGWIFSGVLRAGYVAFFERVRFVVEAILNLLKAIQL